MYFRSERYSENDFPAESRARSSCSSDQKLGEGVSVVLCQSIERIGGYVICSIRPRIGAARPEGGGEGSQREAEQRSAKKVCA